VTDIIDRLLGEAEKAQRKGHLLLAEVCRDASDQLGLVMEERDRLRKACALAAAPLEAMILGGTDRLHSADVQAAISQGRDAARAALAGGCE
jgi:hypothetical protein